MKFLFVGSKKSYQTKRLKEEAEKLGHELDSCYSEDLVIKSDGLVFEPYVNGKLLNDYDLIYLCTGVESMDRYEWYVACEYLSDHSKTKIVNQGVVDKKLKYFPRQTWFYLRQFENGFSQPKTYTVFDDKDLGEIVSDLKFPIILKLSETHRGEGVFKAELLSEIKKIIKDNPDKTYLLREFIPNEGDLRIFVVGGCAVGAMKRVAVKGEFRSNISRGGKGYVYDLEDNPEIKSLAEKMAAISGLEIAGVDIMLNKLTAKPYILEINVGPQFEGMESYTKVNIAEKIIKYFVDKCK